MRLTGLPRIALGTLLLLLLCVVAGRPQVFSDTRAYYALGQEVALIAAPPHQARSSEVLRGRPLSPAAAHAATRLAYTVAASRSPYWSVLFYVAVQIGTAWLVVLAQAATAAAVIWIAARGLGVERAYLPMMAVLALASSLPVDVMFLMPDLFAGLTILAALVLATGGGRLARREVAALWLVMAAGALFHTSHLLVLGALGAGTVVAGAWARRREERRAGTLMLAAAALGLVGALAFPLGVEAMRHEPIYAPPFLSARLIADGPGRALLREDCRSGDEWGWCPYLDRPLRDVNAILWSRAPGVASFQAADYDRRVRIIGEQRRFVLAVVGRFPGAVIAEVAGNVGRLLLQYGTKEALGDPTPQYRDPAFSVFARIVPGTRACADGQASCAPRIDTGLLDAAIGTVLIAAFATIAAVLATRDGRRQWSRPAIFLAAALCLNALVCGGISGNAQRYQSRVTWLVPLLAMAMLADLRPARRGTRGPARRVVADTR